MSRLPREMGTTTTLRVRVRDDGDRARDIAQARRDTEERVAWLMKEWEDLSVRLSAVSAEGS